MLASTTTANGHRRIRQQPHRRQNSIPVTLESAKNPGLASQRYGVHKRGMSLDQRPRSAHLLESAVFQEAVHSQMGDLVNTQPSYLDLSSLNVSSDGECSPFEQDGPGAFTNQNSSSESSSSTFNIQSAFHHIPQQQHYVRTSMSFASNMDISGTSHSRTHSDASSDMLAASGNVTPKDLRRLSVQSSQSAGRPSTPLKQMSSNSLPITPEATPFRQNMDFFPENTMSIQPSQPAYMRRAQSLQGIPGYVPTQAQIDVPSPPNTAPGDCENFDMLSSQESEIESCTFDGFMRTSTFSNGESQTNSNGNNNNNNNTNDDSQLRPSSSESSSFPSPETASMPSAGSNREQQSTNTKNKVPITPGPNLKKPTATTSTSRSSPAKTWLSPKPASIDSLKLDSRVQASIAETGVTIEEIASYISGPDPEDGQYVCLYNDCKKRFGRKENIKSHVQTHLGDRQYKCDLCKKCFVRGHDLKRHAKIHTGDKPYECACGNVFARHDALTRHRQRGMCIGGYKGVVRKPNKRGRPRKNDRSDMEQRLEKAARTRQKVVAKPPSSSLSSSESGSESRSSSPPTTSSSPESTIHFQVSSPSPVPSSGCDNAATNDSSSSSNNNFCMPSDIFSMTPPASPGYSTGNNSDSKKHLASSTHSEQRPFTPCTDSGSDFKTELDQMRQDNLSTLLPPLGGEDATNYLNLDISTTTTTSSSLSSLDSSLSTPQTIPTLMDSTPATSELDLMIPLDHDSRLPDFGTTDPSSSFADFGATPSFMDEFFKGNRNGSSLGGTSELFLEYGDEPSGGSFIL